MSVFPITFVVSACLLAIFILYFARTHAGQRKRGVDQESLLPLEEETPRVVGGVKRRVQGERDTGQAGQAGERTETGTAGADSTERPQTEGEG